MQRRVTALIVGATLAIVACSSPAPSGNTDQPVPDRPTQAVERATDVATQLEQRQSDLEGLTRDPFAPLP